MSNQKMFQLISCQQSACNKFLAVLCLIHAAHAMCPGAWSGPWTPSPATSQLSSWTSHPHHTSHPLGYATTPEGIQVPSLTASQTVGPRGPVLLQDVFLLQKLSSFNRERIPERVVHAKGSGAFGHFVVTDDVSSLTRAKVFNGLGKKTPLIARFSTKEGESGSPDTRRDVRGFAVKFYTQDGIYDLVGINFEMFPIRDAMLFPDINRSRKRNPATHLHDPTMFWDFSSLRPETTLQNLHLFSDEGSPNGPRFMNGAGVHAFKWVNSQGSPIYVKYHWSSAQPWSYLSAEDAKTLEATSPDYFISDLYDAIGRGDYPSWDLCIQVMTFDQAVTYATNPFDPTKVWPREEFPLQKVGRMTLDRNPDDYFTQIESLAFSPGNMVPGIEPSPDRLLQGRLFAYQDAQHYRLGANFAQLPINRPKSRVATYSRDGAGAGCFGRNGKGSPNYYPNSFDGLEQGPSGEESSFFVSGDVSRMDLGDEDNFSQCLSYLENDLDEGGRQRLVDNLAGSLAGAMESVQKRWLEDVAYQISTQFGDKVKEGLERAKGKSMSQKDKTWGSVDDKNVNK